MCKHWSGWLMFGFGLTQCHQAWRCVAQCWYCWPQFFRATWKLGYGDDAKILGIWQSRTTGSCRSGDCWSEASWVGANRDSDDNRWIPNHTKACDGEGTEEEWMGDITPSVFDSTLLWVNFSMECIDTFGMIGFRSSQWTEVKTGGLQRNEVGYPKLHREWIQTFWNNISRSKEHASRWHSEGS